MKTIAVQLPDETERQLRIRASKQGVSLEALLGDLAEREVGDATSNADRLASGIAWLAGRSRDDIDSARNRLLGQPVHPLPSGQSLVEAVEGTWPGDESDAQIKDALDRLS